VVIIYNNYFVLLLDVPTFFINRKTLNSFNPFTSSPIVWHWQRHYTIRLSRSNNGILSLKHAVGNLGNLHWSTR